MASIRSWKSVYDVSDDFFNSHPAFKVSPKKNDKRFSSSSSSSQRQPEKIKWNTTNASKLFIDSNETTANDVRIKFDRHVLESVQSNVSAILSQPSRSPFNSLFNFMRPGSTPIGSPSPRTRNISHRPKKMNGSISQGGSILSSSSSSASSRHGSSNGSTTSSTSLSSTTSSSADFSFSTRSRSKRRNSISLRGKTSNYDDWTTLNHQVHNRLLRMESDMESIPERVKLSIQKKEIPLHHNKTSILMNTLKGLKSKRIALENEIPLIINKVRAQKQPGDAFTRCWDPTTGVKMKVKDIENALLKIEEDIELVKVKEKEPIKMKKIYKNMISRYVKDICKVAAQVKDIKIIIQNLKKKINLSSTTLIDILDMNTSISKDILLLNEKREMNRMNYKRCLLEIKTEKDEYINMLKVDVIGNSRRKNIQIKSKKSEESEAQIKLDVRRVETLTARGAKGWLQESIKNSIPTQKAIKKLQDCDMLRDPVELLDYWGSINTRTTGVNESKLDIEKNIERKKNILSLLEEQRKEASQSIHLFIKEEDEINLWDIQEDIDEAIRNMNVASAKYVKVEKLLAMATHGIHNMIARFINMDKREQLQQEYHAKMLLQMEMKNNSPNGSDAGSRSSSRPQSGHHRSHHHLPNHHNSQYSGRSRRHHHHHHHHHHSPNHHPSFSISNPFSSDEVSNEINNEINNKNVIECLNEIMNNISEKEKIMHNRVGTILTSRISKYCPIIKDLQYSKKGREYVKLRSDLVLNIRSIGLKARRRDPSCMNITKSMLKTINNIQRDNKKGKNEISGGPPIMNSKDIPKINPFLKRKTGKRKSVLAAARQMQASRRMRIHNALLKKKKIVDLLENLDLIQDFIQSDNNDLEGAKWTESEYNWRVNTLEHAGRAPPSVDVKTLRKVWDEVEDKEFVDMRKEEKDFSFAKSGKNRSRSNSQRSNLKRSRNNSNEKIGHGFSIKFLKEEVEKAAEDYARDCIAKKDVTE
jgi:hypothetical protein